MEREARDAARRAACDHLRAAFRALPLGQKDAGATGRLEEIGRGADCGGLAGARHPQAGDARRRRRAHIGVAVADEHRLIRAEPKIAHRAFHHSRRRLAAIAAIVRAVRTDVDRLQPQALRRQHGLEPVMNLFEPRRVEIPARDPRLVGDQDQRKSGVPQQSQPLDRAWRKLDSVRIPQVDLVDDDRPVAIDERDPSRRGRLVHGPTPELARRVHQTTLEGTGRHRREASGGVIITSRSPTQSLADIGPRSAVLPATAAAFPPLGKTNWTGK